MSQLDIYREWAPPPGWRDAVACCWEQRVSADRVQRVLPDGHADVLLYESGATELVGLYDEVALPPLPVGTWIKGIRLLPQVVGPAFRVDAASLRNRTLPIEDVIGSRQSRRLRSPRRLDAWVSSIRPNERTTRAVQLLAGRPVEEVAGSLGMTARHLRRVVQADVGLSPKTYQRVLRLQRFLAAAEGAGGLADAAATAGYADQAHMTRDVRELSGVNPSRLLEERRGPTAA